MKIPIALDPSHYEYTRTAVITIDILSDGLCDIHPNITREEPTAADLEKILSMLPQALSPSLAEVAKPSNVQNRPLTAFPQPPLHTVKIDYPLKRHATHPRTNHGHPIQLGTATDIDTAVQMGLH